MTDEQKMTAIIKRIDEVLKSTEPPLGISRWEFQKVVEYLEQYLMNELIVKASTQ